MERGLFNGGEGEGVGQKREGVNGRRWMRRGDCRESGGVWVVGGFNGGFGDEEHDTVRVVGGGGEVELAEEGAKAFGSV